MFEVYCPTPIIAKSVRRERGSLLYYEVTKADRPIWAIFDLSEEQAKAGWHFVAREGQPAEQQGRLGRSLLRPQIIRSCKLPDIGKIKQKRNTK